MVAATKKRKPFLRNLQRLRKICLSLPDTTEKVSHGEPTFFTRQGVFAMFSNDHHHDGHVGVWLPAPLGLQEALIEEMPTTYYRPPYVGSSGWIGIELGEIDNDALTAHVQQAWRMIVAKKKKPRRSPR